jgi:hypothetical protein
MTPTLRLGFMTKIVRRDSGSSAEIVTSIAIYSCTSVRDAQRETLLKAAMMSGGLAKMKSVRRDADERTDECVVHGTDVCLSSAAIASLTKNRDYTHRRVFRQATAAVTRCRTRR